MIFYPAIDIKDGVCVRLLHGDFAKVTKYNPDPGAQAKNFVTAGCSWIHVVDLDGAVQGQAANEDAVRIILEQGASVQLGGGIRNMTTIDHWIKAGVQRLILGTAALKNPQLVIDAAREYPGKIAVGADAKDGMVAAEGWLQNSDIHIYDLVRQFEDSGVAAVIFTDIGRDGTLEGINIEATANLAQTTALPVIASGGVASIADIKALSEDQRGIAGVIAGRAIYDGRLSVAEALEVFENASC